MTTTRQQVLHALADGPVSGPDLAEELNLTRAAVWNHVDALREAGFKIDGTPAGYVLSSVPEYGPDAVAYDLDCPVTIEYHETIESTNERARSLATAGERDVAVVADAQTAGRGRKDRTWIGPPGGIYVSLLVDPPFTPVEAPLLTMAAAVAARDAIVPTGVTPHIKWPNDLMVATPTGERKLAGILTEVEGEADQLSWAIVGIGINANVTAERLPAEATSLQALRDAQVNRREIVQPLLERFYELLGDPATILPAWRGGAGTLGRAVRVTTGTTTVEGTAIDVSHPGVLLIETDGTTQRVHAGDCEHLEPVQPSDEDK